MDVIKKAILEATVAMTRSLQWHEVLVDAEVEERGRTQKYLADSFVAVCYCKADGEWVDLDLDTSTASSFIRFTSRAGRPMWLGMAVV